MSVISGGVWPIDPNVETGTQLAAHLNELVAAIESGHASPTRPGTIKAGGLWVRTSGTADLSIMFYDGAADHVVGSYAGGQFQLNGRVITANDANPGLRVTQTGAGPALLVEDEANPDSSPFVVDAIGNVGIGTSSPVARMDVRGSIYSATTASAYIALNHDGTNGSVVNSTGEMLFYANGANNMIFHTNSIERARIDSNGNLMVGTQTVITRGKVSVNSNETGYSATISGAAGVGVGLDVQRTTANGDVCYFRGPAGLAGYIAVTGASTCTYNQVSDYRLKENFGPIKNGLSTISQLSPLTYTWKTDGTVGEGFIAHELQAVIPFAVTGEKDAVNDDGSIRPQGVDYSKVVVHLVAAVQELAAKLTAAEARIAALEAKP